MSTKTTKSIDCKYAYVTLFMNNPKYIYGSLVMGYSLKLTNTKYDLVCMVTDDLYDEYAKYLSLVYDRVIRISYIKFEKYKLTSKKHKEIYNNWYHMSYTKWECLKLIEYEKICFLDSDLIILKNIDHLFNLDSPAACFVNYWSEFGFNKRNYYRNIKYGEKISNEIVSNALNNSFVLVAHCVILEPNKDEYDNYKKFISDEFIPQKKCISMYDEQALASFYLTLNKKWTQLHHIYNSIPWKMSKTNMKKNKLGMMFYGPYILHYFNKIKPWMSQRTEWLDIKIWYEIYDKLINDIPTLSEILMLNKIDTSVEIPTINETRFDNIILPEKNTCAYCELLEELLRDLPEYLNDVSQTCKMRNIIYKDINNVNLDILINDDTIIKSVNNHNLFNCLFLK